MSNIFPRDTKLLVIFTLLIPLTGCTSLFQNSQPIEVITTKTYVQPLRLPDPPAVEAPQGIEPIIITAPEAKRLWLEYEAGAIEPFVYGCFSTSDRLRLDTFHQAIGVYIKRLQALIKAEREYFNQTQESSP